MTEPIRRAVRQRCGFGCIICGSSFIEYDHFEPEFADALTHDPDHIILLCPYHHALKTKSPVWIGADEIRAAAENPAARRSGRSTFSTPPTPTHPIVVFGELKCIRSKSILTVDGFNLLSVREPEVQGGPFRVNAFLSNSSGTEMLEIIDNEVRTSTANWDVTLTGATLRVWERARKTALVLRFEQDQIIVERLDMTFRGLEISVLEEHATRLTRNGKRFSLYGATFTESESVASFNGSNMTLGKGGSVSVTSMSLCNSEMHSDSVQDTSRIGGLSHAPVIFPSNCVGLGKFGTAGLVANMFCAFPANDDCFEPLA